MDEVSPLAELLGQIIYEFTQIKPLLPTYGHLIISALFPIYIGAHASLSRPSSAAKPPKKKDQDSDDEDEEGQGPVQKMEGLEPSDALMFPLTAGLTLGGLYLVIKWLEDPAILNKILSFYFSQMGLFFAAAFLKDAFSLLRSFIFPKKYRSGGKVWRAQQSKRLFTTANDSETGVRHSPLPGVLGRIPLPKPIISALWTSRNLAYQRVKIHLHLRGVIDTKFRVGLLDLTSVITALSAVGYFAFVAKPWWLTNFMGFCFCYGALQFMSPSTFGTGSLILASLFFYDIYMVFFTPMMVTVATKLDVPIKLLIPRPSKPDDAPDVVSLAMLGLGDIVIPGMMNGLALRFDLFLYYKKKGARKAQAEGKENELAKPQYQSATGGWGERFWTRYIKPSGLELEPPYHDARSFPKRYFKASLVGYVAGMVTTLLAMQYSNHAQPALLYLVPGVVISLWSTALVKGEIRDMWEFSDAVEEEDEDKEKADRKTDAKNEESTKDRRSLFARLWSGDLKALKESEKTNEKEKTSTSESTEKPSAENDDNQDKDKDTNSETDKDEDSKDLDLFSISISLSRKTKLKTPEAQPSSPKSSISSEDSSIVPVDLVDREDEPPAKRRRRSPRVAKAKEESVA